MAQPHYWQHDGKQALILLSLLHQNSLVFSNHGHESVTANDVNRSTDGGLKKKEQGNVQDLYF